MALSVGQLQTLIHDLRATFGDTTNTVFGITDRNRLQAMAESLLVSFVNRRRAELGDTVNTISAGAFELDRLVRMADALGFESSVPVDAVDATTDATSGSDGGGSPVVDADTGVTDVAPVEVGNATIPQGGRLIRVENPEGSDEPFLYFITYPWRGIEFAYEVGGPDRFRELFGSTDNFSSFTTVTQDVFDDDNLVEVGSIDQELGATESIGSRIERERRALGQEDIPDWIAQSDQALALVGTASAQGWSDGRLWQQLSQTQAFDDRFGAVFDLFRQQNVTIGQAVNQIISEENRLRQALRPFIDGDEEAATTDFLHGLMQNGWTAGSAAQVLEHAEVLRRDPDRLLTSNFILEASGLETLDEVGFLNALNGFAPQETIEALNTASAAVALQEAGIELDDEGERALLELVDTSDRLLTVESFQSLAQELSFNLIRNRHELDIEKLGLSEDDLVAAAFGREGDRPVGEVLGLMARLERDRRAAGQGFDAASGFLDREGRLRIAGLSGV